jgi:hypothetical protein
LNCFIEAVFFAPLSSGQSHTWQDRSTTDYFLFECGFGAVSLRKRTTYPATFVIAHGSRLYFGYGSSDGGDGEFLHIVADSAARTVSVQRDALSVLPLFAFIQDDRIALSSRFEKVCGLANARQLTVDKVALAEFLCSLPTFGRTLCQEIKLLYDRERIEWSPNGSRLFWPQQASQPTWRQRPQTDIRNLRKAIENTIDAHYSRYVAGQPFGCELSGGMDSSLIAGYLQSKGCNPLTVTMLIGGEQGAKQAQKMQALQQQFAFQNFSLLLEAARHYPLDTIASFQAGRPVYHYQIMGHYSLQDELLSHLAAQNVTSMFTGHGGDELCDNIPDYAPTMQEDLRQLFYQYGQAMPPWWTPAFSAYVRTAAQQTQREPLRPLPLVSSSIAGAMARASPAMFDHNIWPVMPLADPQLYAYCQGLPIRYRHNRNLSRMYLQARGFPETIYTGPSGHMRDHYFQAAMANLERPLHYYLQRSVLAAHGLLDASTLLAEFAQAKKHKNDESLLIKDFAFKVVSVLTAEINLQALGLRP